MEWASLVGCKLPTVKLIGITYNGRERILAYTSREILERDVRRTYPLELKDLQQRDVNEEEVQSFFIWKPRYLASWIDSGHTGSTYSLGNKESDDRMRDEIELADLLKSDNEGKSGSSLYH